MEKSPDLLYYYRLTPPRGFVYVSPSATELTGYTPEDHYADPDLGLKIVHPDDVPLLEEQMEHAPRGEPLVLRWQRKDGRLIWTEQQNVGVRDDEGNLIAIVGVARDVTGRRQAEEALARLAEIFESGESAADVVDTTGLVTDWNRAAENLFGYSAAEIVGKSVSVLLPDDLRDEPAEIRRRCMGGEVVQKETRRLRKDGTVVDVVVTASPVHDARGAMSGISVIFHDITERRRMESALRQSEEVFRAAFEQGPIGIALLNVDLTITRANAVLERMLETEPGELVGRALESLTHPEDVLLEKELHGRLVAGEIPSFRLENRFLTKSGRILWGSVTCTVIRDDSGEIVRGLTMIEDVTARKRADENLHRFIANASHELRTPLTAIGGLAAILESSRDRMSAEDVQKSFEAISRQAARAGRLIEDLLDLSRAESGVGVHLEPVNAAVAARRAREAAPPPAGTTVTIVSEDGPVVLADPARLEQVFVNLMSNAYNYGGPEITVSFDVRDGVVLSVADDGPGVSEDVISHLFEAFARGRSGATGSGFGLGLAIVRNIVESFGGAIWYERREPRGARFLIRLSRA